ncbi:DUF3427 domain-containing protein [Pseudarthrobacter sp. NamB4]|uniref:DUF3427 domain-containing protein n=1 Tax=Pseudarthrobacter sp. NamB4 TaxID=2576837 RepID=UPI001F105B2E|nr:DUF3427 domain-containing protein [Pseudarthrobacter sp. NamB4]
MHRAQLVRDIASCPETELEAYLERSGNDVKTVYRSTRAVTSTDAFFVTLNKDDKKHSATTMHKGYAISPELFQWDSQNATSPTSPTGRRYLDHAS